MDPSVLKALIDVQGTAVVTLAARARATRGRTKLIEDAEAVRLMKILGPVIEQTDSRLSRVITSERKIGQLSVYLALRARHFDDAARSFAARNANAVVVNLGAGFDSRFHRLGKGIEVVDVDLPSTVEIKAELLPEEPGYHHVACSVLDPALLDHLAPYVGRPVIFIAEGLLMYLPEREVRRLVLRLRDAFPGSELIAEVFQARMLEGLMGKATQHRLRQGLGFGDEAVFVFGVRRSRELEQWGEGVTYVGDWSPLDEDVYGIDLLPGWLRRLGFARHTLWIVHYALG